VVSSPSIIFKQTRQAQLVDQTLYKLYMGDLKYLKCFIRGTVRNALQAKMITKHHLGER